MVEVSDTSLSDDQGERARLYAAAGIVEYWVVYLIGRRVEEAQGPEVGFTRPVEGTPNVEYLSAANLGTAEDILLATLNAER